VGRACGPSRDRPPDLSLCDPVRVRVDGLDVRALRAGKTPGPEVHRPERRHLTSGDPLPWPRPRAAPLDKPSTVY